MRIQTRHPLLQTLLALLILVNGVLVALQSAHEVAVEGHSRTLEASNFDNNCRDHYEAASIDSGSDEHGHCFQVHMPVHALVTAASPGLYAAGAHAAPVTVPLQLPSQNYAPPVPPPNA